MEFLDIVNEKDEIIGKASKQEIHEGVKILHREIGILLYDEKNRVLLQKRSSKKTLFANEWTVSVTGHVTSGLTPEKAAYMELREELGIQTHLHFIEKRVFETGNHISFGYMYFGSIDSHIVLTLESHSIAKVKFFNKQEIKAGINKNLFGSHTAESLKRYYL